MITDKDLDKQTAKYVKALFANEHERLRVAVMLGDRNAPIQVIQALTAETWALRKLGFMVSDSGRLVKFKPSPA